MIDDDSNELIPFEGGDGDADANTGNNNPDDTQSVTIIQDEQGIVFLGDAGTIDLWLKDEGFDSKAFTAKAVQTISSASKGAQAAGNAMAESGRWVKLTKESAELVAKYGKNCKKGPFQAGVVRQPNGRIIKHLQFTQPGQLNPAMLTGVSGVMAQMALKQAVSEITDYLKEIDAKLDDLLRDQKDQTVSKLAGISHMIDETMLSTNRSVRSAQPHGPRWQAARKTLPPSKRTRSPKSRASPRRLNASRIPSRFAR